MTIKKSPIEAFVEHAQRQPEKIFLRQPLGDQYLTITYAEALAQVRCFASWLQRYPKGSRIAILSLNCAHWLLTDLGIMLAGHVSVPLYPTAASDDINSIIKHSECCCLVVGKLPATTDFVQMLGTPLDLVAIHQVREGMVTWQEIMVSEPIALDSYPEPGDLATLIYTSGTTGMPKGVMIQFQALAEAGIILMDWIELAETDRFFSYLPLAHAAERTAIAMGSFYSGAEVSFAGSIETFSEDLQRARPTIFFAVPRIWLKFQQGVQSKLPSWLLKGLLSVPGIKSILAKKIRSALGMTEVRLAVSGAAALPRQTLDWFEQIGVPICEAYGMTESLGIASFNHPKARKKGSVGKPLPGTEIRFNEENEILYRNSNLMLGYYKQPELSAQVMKDGFLNSGDTGTLDDEGFLWINGRSKDIFKTQKGKYITPVPIESELQPRSGLEQLCVMGANMIQPVVVAAMTEWPNETEREQMESRLIAILEEVNQQLSNNEKLSHWFIFKDAWTTDNGLVTPTLKIRRQALEDRYHTHVMSNLSAKPGIIWVEDLTHGS